MSLQIIGTDPCWNILHDRLKTVRPDLCNKNILLCVNDFALIPDHKTILWLHESPALLKNLIEYIKENPNVFSNSLVYTCIDELQKFDFVKNIHPSNSKWVSDILYLPTKSKLISMISSNKNFTIGHQVRHQVISNLPDCVDLYGRGFKPIENKIEGLKDYCFSIAIENDNTNSYFTEKLLDCFLTCTVPIYWGCQKVSSIFNNDGIIWLDDLQDICSLSYEDYTKRLPAIKENYEIALKQNIDPFDSLINILNEN
jgi:hypothetical protein